MFATSVRSTGQERLVGIFMLATSVRSTGQRRLVGSLCLPGQCKVHWSETSGGIFMFTWPV